VRKLILIKIVFLFSLLISISTYAQDVNLWLGLNVQKKLNSQYSFLGEGQYRLFDNKFSELQMRLGGIYKLDSNWSFAGGVFSSLNRENTIQEFRLWQQIVYSYPIENFSLLIRYRQEQRFFVLNDEFANRSRLQLRVNYEMVESFTPYFATEFFVGLNESSKSNFASGYNQNRTQVGGVFKLSSEKFIEASFMQVNTQGIGKKSQNTVLWTSFQFRF